MSKSRTDKATVASGTSAIDDDKPLWNPSSSPPLTFKAVIYDVASWWCYAILKSEDLKMFDDLDGIFESLQGPLSASSPLSIRLRCLVPWEELLRQLEKPGSLVGDKQFETIQDKLLLLHQQFFSQTPAREEFNDVLRMVQTHSVLSKLYNYFSKSDTVDSGHASATNKILDQCGAEWESIYLGSDAVPPVLADLVNKTNGWDFEDRKDHIVQIVSFPDSTLTYTRLKKKLKSLLLRWFENEIVEVNESGGSVPELLGKRYRGIGYGNDESTSRDAVKFSDGFRSSPRVSRGDNFSCRKDSSTVVCSANAQQQQTRNGPAKHKQRRISKNNRKCDTSEQEKGILVMESSDENSDWSEFDPEEQLKRLKLHRERQKRYRDFSRKHQTSTDQQMEGLPMPVGEPSYSEASPQRRTIRGRKRRRLDDQVNIRNAARVGPKEEVYLSSSSSTSTSSYSRNFEEHTGLWTEEEDEALKNGIKWNGYGNWMVILKKEKRLLGSRDEDELRVRAHLLLTH